MSQYFIPFYCWIIFHYRNFELCGPTHMQVFVESKDYSTTQSMVGWICGCRGTVVWRANCKQYTDWPCVVQVNCIWIDHIMFIHSSVEHLGCFHVLALIYNTTNICVLVFLWTFIGDSFGELLSQMITLCLTFWGFAKLFSKGATLFYMLTSNV